MSMPIYASPEQLMRDRSEFARKGISRGRSVVATTFADGVLFVAENHSPSLHKVSEIYDRLGFAAVGRYNEFENLRVAGIRYADLRGYSYDRADVTARALANSYAQTIGAVFTQEQKPFEIEIVVAEVGSSSADDQIFRLTYDGSVADEQGFVAMGGASDQAEERLGGLWHPGMPLGEALRVAVDVLGSATSGPAANGGGAAAPAGGTGGVTNGGTPSTGTAVRRDLDASMLEVAVLDRDRPRRTFRRIAGPLLERLLSDADPTTHAPATDEQHPGHPDLLTGELQPPD